MGGDKAKLPQHHKKTTKTKKKKGRPSLLDLQKRQLEEFHRQHLLLRHSSKNPSPSAHPNSSSSSNPLRRSTRRNPSAAANSEDLDEEESEGEGRRREKKLKFVLRLPNSGPGGSGSEDEEGEAPLKKRRINAVGVGRGSEAVKVVGQNSSWKVAQGRSEAATDSGPATQLPDKKILIFILDRIQKKDTYGVFSEPVDPNELPDYHDIIEHPMDFGTVRSKLSSGAYANLEQFEKDVFLICTNAMRYNAPDTVYFRQARSIEELARKNFENLRQDSEGNEPEVKIVRRGRPPGKTSIKKQLGHLSVERAGSDATLATTADNRFNVAQDSLRKETDKSGFSDTSGKNHNCEASGLGTDNRFDRSDEFSGFMLKSMSKFGKKPIVLDENRRNTYNLSLQSQSGCELSVVATFQNERKQLIPIGIHMDHAYARSLARFAANLGPVAWRIASRKIERALPSGAKFGPGWVGESECSQQPQPPLFANSSSQSLQPLEPSQPPCQSRNLACSSVPTLPETKSSNLLATRGPSSSVTASETHLNRYPQPTPSSSVQSRCSESIVIPESLAPKNYEAEYNLCNSNNAVLSKSTPQHQNLPTHSPINGFNPGFLPNSSSQTRNQSRLGGSLPGNSCSPDAFTASRNVDIPDRSTNSFLRGMPPSQAGGATFMHTSTNCSGPMPEPGHLGQSASLQALHFQSSHQGLLPRSNPDPAPPDLNVRFQSANSPGSGGVMVDPQQPDLALQL